MNTHLDAELKHVDIEPPICWERIFQNTSPVEVEIGFGKCKFLIDIATHYPSINFVGIELSRKYYRKGIKKIQRVQLTNIKLIWGEAFHIFKRYVPDTSITNIYINFSDPWPKKRHAKRRLLRPELMTLVAQKLAPAGCIEIATDVESYMNETNVFLQADDIYEMIYYTTNKHQNTNQRLYFSEYEMMFLKEGKTIYYTKYRKRQP